MARVLAKLICCLIYTGLLAVVAGSLISDELKVTLKHGGVLVGRYTKSEHGRYIREFLGIPYAKPPLGDLRFSAPVPADSWKGERMATEDGKFCSQMVRSKTYAGEEDCLYLNVFTPLENKTNELLPVLIWIPGGGFAEGEGTVDNFSPKLLLDRNMILVSINYRLSTLGFLSSETLDIPGNFGLKDQLMAFRWVKEHIGAFGGDANRVTISGQSAGGASVAFHTKTEKSKGLFHRAISQSGSCYNSWAEPAPKGHAADIARKVAKAVGCGANKSSWANILKCLRTVPGRNLTEAYIPLLIWDYAPLSLLSIVVEPEHKDAYLTHPLQASNYSNSIPLMIGFTKDEGVTFVSLHTSFLKDFKQFKKEFDTNFLIGLDLKYIPKKDQEFAKKSIENFYFKNGIQQNQNLTDAFSDSHFIRGIDKYIRQRMSSKYEVAPTYVYQFKHKGEVSGSLFATGEFTGVAHGDDLFYMYPRAEKSFPSKLQSKRDLELEQNFLDLWYNFVAVGNPTPAKSPLEKWNVNKSYPPTSMRIGSLNTYEPLLQMIDDYPENRMSFWYELESSLTNRATARRNILKMEHL